MHPDDTYLPELANRHFGTGRPVSWERVADGASTIVYRFQRGTERFYLRILPAEGSTFAPEVLAHQLAGSLGCSVPEVLAYELLDPVLQRSTMLTTEIAGTPIAADTPVDTAAEIVRAAGSDLARINSIPVQGYGWIDRGASQAEDRLYAEHPDLASMIEREYRQVIERLPDDAVPGLSGDTLRERLLDAIAIVLNVTGSFLAHGDFDTTHIFADKGRYSGIIDFGEIRGMPRLYDIGHHLMHDRERLPYSTFGWLLEGYGEVTALPEAHREMILAWSRLIAARALLRGLERNPASPIVATARRSIARAGFSV